MNEFLSTVKQDSWPFSIELARLFATWALTVKGLSNSTVTSYLSSIKLAHTLDGAPCPDFFKDDILKMILKGAGNIRLLQGHGTFVRPAMTMNSLLLLGHWLTSCNWSAYSTQVVWSACLVSFKWVKF